MATIAIILINYNSTRLTKLCIKSLLANREKEDEYRIVVWDNGSKVPPSQQDVLGADLVCSPKNDGFSGGNNNAVTYALKRYNPEFIFLLNNDTRVTKGSVRALVEALEADPTIGCTTAKIYFEKGCEYHKSEYTLAQKGKVLWYGGGGIDWQNCYGFHRYVDEVDQGQVNRGDCEFATGCAMMMRASLWKKLGGFDNRYFLYYEDTDLSMRIRSLGLRILIVPESIVYHRNAGSTQGSGSTTHVYYQTRNRLLFGFRYAGFRAKFALLQEARRMYLSGDQTVRTALLHAMGGRWGKR